MCTTGAVLPSGRRLSAALAEPVRDRRGLAPDVLEVGAGTGPVTRELLPLLDAESRLDVVEANPRFAGTVGELVDAYADGHGGRAGERIRERVRVHEAFVEELETDRRYDVLISGLPFANFTPSQVDLIMRRYLRLLRPGGTLTYFAYCATSTARALVASRAETSRHRAVERLLAGYRRHYAVARRTVWGNLPPAHVWQLRAPGAASGTHVPDAGTKTTLYAEPPAPPGTSTTR
jgi:phosphatidylethanolamine/phosphatidyl-N-methylethanolamine N-methyltransferase